MKIAGAFMGGLGNQLFIAAHALAQGIKHDREVVFIPSSYTPGQGRNASNYTNNVFRNLKFVDDVSDFTIISEGPFEYTEVNPVENNTLFHGYFQSTKNWFGYEEKIRNYFLPYDGLIPELVEKYPDLRNEGTLSLHVRRSEYLAYPRKHPTVTLEYIQEALKEIGGYSTVFVFSDDHDWVKENLNLPNAVYVNEDQDYKEMWLMSLCENHIISNSTFSWWGSFLNTNPNKKVVAPSVWFGPDGPNGKDIYEPYWKTIPVEWTEGGKLVPVNN